MKSMMIMYAVRMVMGFLTPELLLKLVGNLNEKVGAFILKSDNTVDDAIWAVLKTGGGTEIKVVVDTVLDFGERYVIGSVSKLDDAIMLPFFAAVRAAGNIPDND